MKTKMLRFVFCAAIVVSFGHAWWGQGEAPVVVFGEPGSPTADTAAVSADQLAKIVPGARVATAEQLKAELARSEMKLLVLGYGSAFPENSWGDIFSFLRRGGNLLVIGGRPFTRSAYKDAAGWHLRNYSVRFLRQLLIDQYQTAPGSEGLEFHSNPDVAVTNPAFSWKKSVSPVIRLSAVDLYARGGSAGSIDARLDALAYAAQKERRMAAPIFQVDHLQNRVYGGRYEER